MHGEAMNAQDKERLNALIDSLLENPFAKSQEWASVSVEQLGELLEQSRANLETASNVPKALKDNLEKYLADYCLLLLELEVQATTDYSQDTLSDLRHRGTGTNILTSPSPKNYSPDSAESEPVPLMPEEENEKWFGADQEEGASIPLAENEEEEETQAGFDETLHRTAAEASKTLFEVFENVVTSEAPEKPAPVVEALPTPPPPPTSFFAEEDDEPSVAEEVNAITETAEKDEAQVESQLQPESEKAAPGGLSPRAADYWKIAHYFAGLSAENSFPVGEEYLHRLQAIALCSSVEAECAHRFLVALRNLWPGRKETVVHLANQNETRFHFDSSVTASLTELAENKIDMLLDSKFPLPGIVNSFRYLLSVDDSKRWKPTLLDFGVVVFFMGQTRPLGERSTKNFLHLSGVSEDEVDNLFLLLLRLNKLKIRALEVSNDFTREHLDLTRSDMQSVLELLKKLSVPDSSRLLQVA